MNSTQLNDYSNSFPVILSTLLSPTQQHTSSNQPVVHTNYSLTIKSNLEHDDNYMATTNMNVSCGAMHATNCTKAPGANMASPITLFLLGAIGNALAIGFLHGSQRREKSRTVFYLLVGSLAWTDLLGILLTTPPVLLVYMYKEWPGGAKLCNFHAFTMISFSLITPLIVCTMAIERYIGIKHGYFYQKHINRTMTKMVLLMQWVFVLLFSALPFFGIGSYAVQYPKTWCYLNIHPKNIMDTIYAVIFSVINLLLILVIIIANIAVTLTLLIMRFRRRHENSPSKSRHVFRSKRQSDIELQMVVILIAITCLFTVCWSPLMIQILYNQFYDHGENHKSDLMAVRLASINQTFDPWLYILFRKVVFTRCFGCWNQIFVGRTRSDKQVLNEEINPMLQTSIRRSRQLQREITPNNLTTKYKGNGVVVKPYSHNKNGAQIPQMKCKVTYVDGENVKQAFDCYSEDDSDLWPANLQNDFEKKQPESYHNLYSPLDEESTSPQNETPTSQTSQSVCYECQHQTSYKQQKIRPQSPLSNRVVRKVYNGAKQNELSSEFKKYQRKSPTRGQDDRNNHNVCLGLCGTSTHLVVCHHGPILFANKGLLLSAGTLQKINNGDRPLKKKCSSCPGAMGETALSDKVLL